jgi:hypothetical protein
MYVGALANEQSEEMLLRGFTTVRDIGGPTVGLHRVLIKSAGIAYQRTPKSSIFINSKYPGKRWSKYL